MSDDEPAAKKKPAKKADSDSDYDSEEAVDDVVLDLPAANPVLNKIKLAQKPLNPLPVASSSGASVGAMRRQGTLMGGGTFK